MTEPADQSAQRRRRRTRVARGNSAASTRGQAGGAEPPPVAAPVADAHRPTRAARPARAPRPPRAEREPDSSRGLKDLIGGGPSQVDVSRAMRARDVNRPTPRDLADAERDVDVVRRHWRPKG
jgi:hypothetical protein